MLALFFFEGGANLDHISQSPLLLGLQGATVAESRAGYRVRQKRDGLLFFLFFRRAGISRGETAIGVEHPHPFLPKERALQRPGFIGTEYKRKRNCSVTARARARSCERKHLLHMPQNVSELRSYGSRCDGRSVPPYGSFRTRATIAALQSRLRHHVEYKSKTAVLGLSPAHEHEARYHKKTSNALVYMVRHFLI